MHKIMGRFLIDLCAHFHLDKSPATWYNGFSGRGGIEQPAAGRPKDEEFSLLIPFIISECQFL
jgi:hypothetical protein